MYQHVCTEPKDYILMETWYEEAWNSLDDDYAYLVFLQAALDLRLSHNIVDRYAVLRATRRRMEESEYTMTYILSDSYIRAVQRYNAGSLSR